MSIGTPTSSSPDRVGMSKIARDMRPACNAFAYAMRAGILTPGSSEHDDYIKSYLKDPKIPFITKIKIGLRMFEEVFGQTKWFKR